MKFNNNNDIETKNNNDIVKIKLANSNTDIPIRKFKGQIYRDSGGWLGKFFGVDTNKSIIYSGIVICIFCLIIWTFLPAYYRQNFCIELNVEFIEKITFLIAGYIFGANRSRN